MQAGIDLVVLQHPNEAKHALNTARIAALGIGNCTLFTGEDFTEHKTLHAFLAHRHTCLLFPTSNALPPCQVLLETEQRQCCIILDGTWRKARKIYHSNPFLHGLPCIALNPDQVTRYRIRKAPSEQSLSTVEAIVTLLRQAEGNSRAYQPLLDAFDLLINQQVQAMGTEVYRSNYRQHPGFSADSLFNEPDKQAPEVN